MSFLLCIDTALETASIALSEDGEVIALKSNQAQADHAAWIHVAINEMLAGAGRSSGQLDGVALASGPGSYTGLRVGMATAKGLCYALSVPLVTENILFLTAMAALRESEEASLICPMIDARRMEVFTALYDNQLRVVEPPAAKVLEPGSFGEELQAGVVIFCGNGAEKWSKVCADGNARFAQLRHKIEDLASVCDKKFLKNEFANLAYSEPDYFKNFYSGK